MQAGQDLYQRLIDNFYNLQSLQTLLDNTTFYSLEGQSVLDGPAKPTFEWFDYMTSGFVHVKGDYNLPPHEDSILAAQINHSSEYYSDWLLKTGNRKCAIMIPVQGDFKNTYTDLYDKDKNKLTGFSLEDGPVLYPTAGDILHGVNNINKGNRITYQLSFKEDYNEIRNKILAAGLAKV